MLRVRFVSPLSKQQQASFAERLALYVAEQTGDSLSPNLALQESAKQVFSADYYDKFMLYVLIVVLSVQCGHAVRVLPAAEPRRLTYRYLGATGGRIFAATALEVLFYTLLAFTAGWLLKDVVIRLTPLKYTVPALGAGTYLLLFAAFAAVTLLMLGLFMRTLRANGRSEREPLVSAGKARPAPAPAARLPDPEELFRRYSDRAHPAHAGVFVAFSATYALTYIYERGGSGALSAATAAATTRFISLKLAAPGGNQRRYVPGRRLMVTTKFFPVFESRQRILELPALLESLPGVRSVGLMNEAYMLPARDDPMFEIKETKHLHPMNVALSDGTTGWFLYEYSRGLCEDMSLPMKEGVWLTEWADRGGRPYLRVYPHRRPPGVVRNLRLRPRRRHRHQHGV